MRNLTRFLFLFTMVFILSCSNEQIKTNDTDTPKILFLHHSTGQRIWQGDMSSLLAKIKFKITKESAVSAWFKSYNKDNKTKYLMTEQAFPKRDVYGWNNYPYDYYNIWVKNAGNKLFKEEPTLEILTRDYNVIIWKHCYPVSDILKDIQNPDINSPEKRIENYKLQYKALKEKMHQFPNTKFIVWTGAALLETRTTKAKAERAKLFFDWVKNSWNEENDNIYIWDFHYIETQGGLFMDPDFASGEKDNHPNNSFSGNNYILFCQRIVDIIENNGKNTNILGEITSK